MDLARKGRLGWETIGRNKILIAVITFLCIGIGGLFLFLRPETYTASSRILIDNRLLTLQQQDAIYSVTSINSQLMDSQVEILHSDNIARRVIEKENLLSDADFVARPESEGAADTVLPDTASPSPAEGKPNSLMMRRALRAFQKRLSVNQVGQSYVIEIQIKHSDPQKAADITNSLVEAYLADQAAANASSALAASGWLRSRLATLGTTARILTPGIAPIESDGPRAAIILGFSVFCGLLIATGVAFARDLFDRRIGSRNAVQSAAGTECFGNLPEIKVPTRSLFRRREKIDPEQGVEGKVRRTESLAWCIVYPRSLFAHTLRRTRAALFPYSSSAVVTIGVTSVMPGEGKTTVTANLARLTALWGKKVLLVDAAPYNSRLTRMLAPHATAGIGDVLQGTPLDEVVLADPWSPMHFLPGMLHLPYQEHDAFVSKDTETFLAQIKSMYDVVIIDLPPINPVPDVYELVHVIDKLLLVMEWRRCTEEQIAKTLGPSSTIRRKLVGAVLNKVDPKSLRSGLDEAGSLDRAAHAAYIQETAQPHDRSEAKIFAARNEPAGSRRPDSSEALSQLSTSADRSKSEGRTSEKEAETDA